MKAVLCRRRTGAALAGFENVDLPAPAPGPRDLLVRIEAAALNPLDCKRRSARPDPDPDGAILGWDAAGTIESLGAGVTGFRVGDRVFYSGSILRPGCLSELHLVDERLAARRPDALSPAQACALPLAALTASEALWDHLGLGTDAEPGVLLIVGGAGSVASMAVQLARTIPRLTIVAAVSRPASRDWLHSIGADHVVSYLAPYAEQFEAANIPPPRRILSMFTGAAAWRDYVTIAEPFGRICIVDHPQGIDFSGARSKSLGIFWQAMFTRSSWRTEDMARQGAYLRQLGVLIESGAIRALPVTGNGTIDAHSVEAAHAADRPDPGKRVFEGFRA
ncbi:MAG: NADPH:quinone reductase [Alphaproteobacteria bacterium]|nr:NADPH:quinone reductase [Alphaproteobacteria bacterium]